MYKTTTVGEDNGAHWLEASHGLAGKLCSDGMMGERFREEDECRGRGHIPPIQQVVQLERWMKEGGSDEKVEKSGGRRQAKMGKKHTKNDKKIFL